MAKLVIWAGPQRSVDETTCYRQGDILCVREDGAPNAANESLPNFVFLQFNGVPVDHPRLVSLLEAESGQYRRLWFLRRADLPLVVRQTWIQDPDDTIYIEVPGFSNPGAPPADYTWDQVKQYVRNKVTDNDLSAGETF